MIDVLHHFIRNHDTSVKEYIEIHEQGWVRFIDKYIYVAAIVGIILTLPQLWDVWVVQEVAGLSLISWTSYFLASLLWTLYGVGHKEKTIIVINSTWALLHLAVVVGIVVFK